MNSVEKNNLSFDWSKMSPEPVGEAQRHKELAGMLGRVPLSELRKRGVSPKELDQAITGKDTAKLKQIAQMIGGGEQPKSWGDGGALSPDSRVERNERDRQQKRRFAKKAILAAAVLAATAGIALVGIHMNWFGGGANATVDTGEKSAIMQQIPGEQDEEDDDGGGGEIVGEVPEDLDRMYREFLETGDDGSERGARDYQSFTRLLMHPEISAGDYDKLIHGGNDSMTEQNRLFQEKMGIPGDARVSEMENLGKFDEWLRSMNEGAGRKVDVYNTFINAAGDISQQSGVKPNKDGSWPDLFRVVHTWVDENGEEHSEEQLVLGRCGNTISLVQIFFEEPTDEVIDTENPEPEIVEEDDEPEEPEDEIPDDEPEITEEDDEPEDEIPDDEPETPTDPVIDPGKGADAGTGPGTHENKPVTAAEPAETSPTDGTAREPIQFETITEADPPGSEVGEKVDVVVEKPTGESDEIGDVQEGLTGYHDGDGLPSAAEQAESGVAVEQAAEAASGQREEQAQSNANNNAEQNANIMNGTGGNGKYE